uniref:Uncharacterized protein n=1 Tax=Sphaerodactylus townsendi TaxID=933632 RepID=A0ACB8EML5_9SAUR
MVVSQWTSPRKLNGWFAPQVCVFGEETLKTVKVKAGLYLSPPWKTPQVNSCGPEWIYEHQGKACRIDPMLRNCGKAVRLSASRTGLLELKTDLHRQLLCSKGHYTPLSSNAALHGIHPQVSRDPPT